MEERLGGWGEAVLRAILLSRISPDCRVLLLPLLTVFRVLGRLQAGARRISSYSSYKCGLRES